MPLGLKPADIKDEELRRLLSDARAAFDAGDHRECVERCADAYLLALTRFPSVREGLQRTLENEGVQAGIAAGVTRVAPFMWPRFAAKLDLESVESPEPRIVFERKNISFGETIEYYEFTLDLITTAEAGAPPQSGGWLR